MSKPNDEAGTFGTTLSTPLISPWEESWENADETTDKTMMQHLRRIAKNPDEYGSKGFMGRICGMALKKIKFLEHRIKHLVDVEKNLKSMVGGIKKEITKKEAALSEIRALPDEWDADENHDSVDARLAVDQCAAQLRKILEKYDG